MRQPIPGDKREAALNLLRRGHTAVAAAHSTGVNVNTIRSWKARERLTADFPSVLPEVDSEALPTREELLHRLDQQSRAGRVTATVALLKLMPVESSADAEHRAAAQRLLSLVPGP